MTVVFFPKQTSVAQDSESGITNATVTVSGVTGKRTTILRATGACDNNSAGQDLTVNLRFATVPLFTSMLPVQDYVDLVKPPLEITAALGQTVQLLCQGTAGTSSAALAWRQD